MFMEIGIRQFFDSQSLVKCASKLLFGLPSSRRYILISAFQIVHGDIRILHLVAKLQILFERSQMTYTLGSADNTMVQISRVHMGEREIVCVPHQPLKPFLT
jgi:hypothetical protein